MVDFLEPVTNTFAVLVRRAAELADGADGCFPRLGGSACAENPPVAPHLEMKALEGMQLWCITVNFGLKKEAKC